MKGINRALIELHECGLAHNDVRQPNVCFDDEYEPVLIDLDRCSKSGKISSTYGASCMYPFADTGHKFDYMQLGWLVAWVLDKDVEN